MSTRGSSIVTDGLVMCLDKYDRNSYLGEPTTNVVYYTNLNTGWSQGYNTDIVFDEIDPPVGIDSPTVGFKDANTDGYGYWYSYGNYAPQGDGVQYTVSIYVRIAQDNPLMIQFYTADNSESGRISGEARYVNYAGETNSSGTILNNNVVDRRGWVRIVWNAITTANPNDSDSLSFNWGTTGNFFTASRMWLCAPQMETTGHATRYVGNSANNGTTTTRSLTDGWQDLSGNGNHADLTALTYSSTYITGTGDSNDFSFDGTDDYLDLGVSGVIPAGGNNYTVSAWFNIPDSVAGYREIISQWTPGTSSNAFFLGTVATDNIRFSDSWNSVDIGTWSTGVWHHLVAVSTTTNAYIYFDNVLKATKGSALGYTGSGNLIIGRQGTIDGEYWKGEIAGLSIYDKALTGVEISQNFNAQKTRYGL